MHRGPTVACLEEDRRRLQLEPGWSLQHQAALNDDTVPASQPDRAHLFHIVGRRHHQAMPKIYATDPTEAAVGRDG